MSLQKEITIILLVVIGLFAGLDNAIQRFIIYPSYQKIDEERAIENVERFQVTLEREVYHLNQLALDWATRDETYKFIQDKNENYKNANLTGSFFADIDIDSIHFVDRKGKVVWGNIFDVEDGEPIIVEELPYEQFSPSHPFLQHESPQSSVSGFIATSQGPMLISARPIVASDHGEPIVGALIMGKFIDESLLAILSGQSGIDLELWTYRCNSPGESLFSFNKLNCLVLGDSVLTEIDHQSFLEAYSGKIVVNPSEEEDHLHSYAVITGVLDNHFLLLRANSPMVIIETGRGVLNGAILSILTAGLLIVIVLREAIKMSVLGPISRLTDYAVALRDSETFDSHISDTLRSNNEIGILAREFDLMVSRLGQARRQLVEQSYFSGMAEMASGVMHNIRNALTPIIGHVDLMKEELKDIPINEMEAAANEISSGDIPEERLEILKDFQKGSFQYLTEAVSDFRVRLDGMAERVAAIENIIDSQEKYASGRRATDDIDLEILSHEAMAMLRVEHFQTIDIEIDASLGEVGQIKGPRNALMYIFTNLINNAAEAIIQAEREQGLIRISAETEKADGLTFVHVMISDNGCGILRENLNRIFERDYSSKSGETSGIGLHWCSNTVASFHGRLYAESKGVDRGSTIHLHIPKNPADLK